MASCMPDRHASCRSDLLVEIEAMSAAPTLAQNA